MRKQGTHDKIGRDRGIVSSRLDTHIPFLAGRPERESAIDQDDITNILIALYASKSLDEFIDIT